jgi:hypothetical protein
LYYPNWHIALTKSQNKTASATAAAASHHELCMMAMATAIKPLKKNKNQNQYSLLRALVTNATSNLFYLLAKLKKIRNSKIR